MAQRNEQERNRFLRSSETDSKVSSVSQFDEKLQQYRRKRNVSDPIDEERGRSSSFGSSLQTKQPPPKSLIPVSSKQRPSEPLAIPSKSSEDISRSWGHVTSDYPKSPSSFTRPELWKQSNESLTPSPRSFRRNGPAYSTLPRLNVTFENMPHPSTLTSRITNRNEVTDAPLADEKEYRMNHPNRGKAIIFNHKEFQDESLPPRYGAEVDVQRLQESLLKLGFRSDEISVHYDLEYKKINQVLDKVMLDDHKDNDCLMVFILTHGDKDDRIHAHDVDYRVDKLWQRFSAEKCQTLAGKPKIFFVLACRGTNMDDGVSLQNRRGRKMSLNTETDAAPIGGTAVSYTIPIWADFLTIYSTVHGYYSYRDMERGTWYVEALCKEINDNKSDDHFMDLLTKVNRRVAVSYSSYHDQVEKSNKKQCPFITSTLTRLIYMKNKG